MLYEHRLSEVRFASCGFLTIQEKVLGPPSTSTLEVVRLNGSKSRVRFPMLSLEFFSDIILPVAL